MARINPFAMAPPEARSYHWMALIFWTMLFVNALYIDSYWTWKHEQLRQELIVSYAARPNPGPPGLEAYVRRLESEQRSFRSSVLFSVIISIAVGVCALAAIMDSGKRLIKKRATRHCYECDYDLQGHTELPTCPECGADHARMRLEWERYLQLGRWRFAGLLILVRGTWTGRVISVASLAGFVAAYIAIPWQWFSLLTCGVIALFFIAWRIGDEWLRRRLVRFKDCVCPHCGKVVEDDSSDSNCPRCSRPCESNELREFWHMHRPVHWEAMMREMRLRGLSPEA